MDYSIERLDGPECGELGVGAEGTVWSRELLRGQALLDPDLAVLRCMHVCREVNAADYLSYSTGIHNSTGFQ